MYDSISRFRSRVTDSARHVVTECYQPSIRNMVPEVPLLLPTFQFLAVDPKEHPSQGRFLGKPLVKLAANCLFGAGRLGLAREEPSKGYFKRATINMVGYFGAVLYMCISEWESGVRKVAKLGAEKVEPPHRAISEEWRQMSHVRREVIQQLLWDMIVQDATAEPTAALEVHDNPHKDDLDDLQELMSPEMKSRYGQGDVAAALNQAGAVDYPNATTATTPGLAGSQAPMSSQPVHAGGGLHDGGTSNHAGGVRQSSDTEDIDQTRLIEEEALVASSADAATGPVLVLFKSKHNGQTKDWELNVADSAADWKKFTKSAVSRYKGSKVGDWVGEYTDNRDQSHQFLHKGSWAKMVALACGVGSKQVVVSVLTRDEYFREAQ
ncbi:hypothetical protein K504DRAFT_460676 [Pleomassaria siparia CBS 279.74]|nr:hypothetical protein K504DRAFT_460676 [Pleomassaria siparia CBS 279.74]